MPKDPQSHPVPPSPLVVVDPPRPVSFKLSDRLTVELPPVLPMIRRQTKLGGDTWSGTLVHPGPAGYELKVRTGRKAYALYLDADLRLHLDGAPAWLSVDAARRTVSSKRWYRHGLLHRLVEPAMSNGRTGYQAWWLNGKRHRIDGPAVVRPGGSGAHLGGAVEFWVNGEFMSPAEFSRRTGVTTVACPHTGRRLPLILGD